MSEKREDDLLRNFQAWGLPDAEAWTRSEIDEEIPQYARYVFLRGAWENIVASRATDWLAADPGREGTEDDVFRRGGQALERLLAAGAAPEDLTAVVRWMQFEAVFGVLYLLDDPGVLEYPTGAAPADWGLFEIGADDEPGRRIAGLYESFLSLDPEQGSGPSQ
jgi:hypothetical protein